MATKQKKIPQKLRGIFLLIFSLLLFLSLFSFSTQHHESNYLGLLGHGLGYTVTYLLGLSSFFLPFYLGWVGAILAFEKGAPKLLAKTTLFATALLSFSCLLVFVSRSFPFAAALFSKKIHGRFLGGVPLHHLYVDYFLIFFGKIGSVLIFTTLFFSALYFLLRDLLPSFEKVQKIVPVPNLMPEAKKEEVEIFEPPYQPLPQKKKIPETPKLPPAPRKTFGHYTLPPPTLLTPAKKSEVKTDMRSMARILEETLLSFGIEAKVGNISVGPTIVSFEVHPSIGVKVQKIKALENDIALNMQAKSIRIIAPIPGKAAVGIEVPNPYPQEVGFREILESYLHSEKKMAIPLLLGKGVSGEEVWADLTKMPHMIIAGATGSGKSVCINTIVMSILTNAHPSEIKLLMVDPKKVELTAYSGLPHMLAPVITEASEAHSAFIWLTKEMERRYEIFRRLGIRNISFFNERKIDEKKEAELSELGIEIPKELPYIVAIVDELADLMMVSSNDIETPIARIAQMARAVGIHLILATQRPSREVITGLIKANFPTRIAFKVASRVNSQIIIDENGAEMLLGNGDMLFMPPGTSNLLRAQGAYIRDEDIAKVIEFICKQLHTQYLIPSFKDYKVEEKERSSEQGEEGDSLYNEAKTIIFETGNASTTFLQRKLKIGYARAASLMDQLESNGIIGPQEGAKPRKIFYP